MSRKPFTAVFALCLALWALDLRAMGGGRLSFSAFDLQILAAYSLPPAAVLLLLPWANRRIPRPLARLLPLGVLAFSLWLPCLRYLPGYRPDALEGLKYMFGPLYEGAFILLVLALGSIVRRLFPKRADGDAQSPSSGD